MSALTCGPFCQGTAEDHAEPVTGYVPCFACGHVASSEAALDRHASRGHVTPTLDPPAGFRHGDPADVWWDPERARATLARAHGS